MEKARCCYCGYEGIYGEEVVDTDCIDSTGLDSIKLACKDIEACLDRQSAKETCHA